MWTPPASSSPWIMGVSTPDTQMMVEDEDDGGDGNEDVGHD